MQEINIKVLTTSSGIRFALHGEKPKKPAPVLFNFSAGLEDLAYAIYGEIGHRLVSHGVLSVSIDLPCHGQESLAGEPVGLPGWSFRMGQGRNVAAELGARATALLDYLVNEGYADPARIAAVGTSRGGFQALHWAAAEPRIKAVAAFAPVTNLLALHEFASQAHLDLIHHLDLTNEKILQALAGRPIWLAIGNNDQRVDTDSCIRFARQQVRCALERKLPAPVELHVVASEAHGLHPTAHEDAAAWMLPRL